jgi:hypothetical protein
MLVQIKKEKKCEKCENLIFWEWERWKGQVYKSQKWLKNWSDERHDVGEREDYFIRQKRNLKLSDLKDGQLSVLEDEERVERCELEKGAKIRRVNSF